MCIRPKTHFLFPKSGVRMRMGCKLKDTHNYLSKKQNAENETIGISLIDCNNDRRRQGFGHQTNTSHSLYVW